MQYIGCFEIENNNILICDPLATKIANYFYKVRTLNVLRLRVDQVVNGLWYGYHLYNREKTYPVGMLIFHKEYNTQKLSYEKILENWHYEGKVCISFGHMVSAMDKTYFNDKKYSYTMIDEYVVFDIAELLEVCEKEMPEEKNKKKLTAFLNERLKTDNQYIECAEFIELLGDYVPSISESNLWSIDCHNRCSNQLIPAGTLKGGIVSRAALDFCQVYTHPERNAIYITLDEEQPLFDDTSKKKADILSRFEVIK